MFELGWFHFRTVEADGPTSWSGEIVEIEMPFIRVVELHGGRERLINAHLTVLEADRLPGKPQIRFELLPRDAPKVVTE